MCILVFTQYWLQLTVVCSKLKAIPSCFKSCLYIIGCSIKELSSNEQALIDIIDM